MDLFYKYNKNYDQKKCNIRIKNVKLVDLNEDFSEIERKPEKIKYFKEPELTKYPLNLNDGFEHHRFRKMDVMYGNTLSKVLKWAISGHSIAKKNKDAPFFVYTHRQAIINIMKSHSYKYECAYFDWNLYVTKHGSNLYMYLENDDNPFEANPNLKIRSYHYKLEQVLFSDSPFTEPNTDVPVDENIRLNGIYSCQLGNFNLIYSAEVQGISSDTEINDLTNMDSLNKCRFVNTKVAINDKRFSGKQLQKYFQNILANVDVTYWAFRDKNGYVHDPIKPFYTSEMCKNQFWNPKEYEQFLYDFISLIVDKMSNVNSLETTYEFQYRSADKAVYYKVNEGKTDKSFLADDYIQFMEKKQKLKEFLINDATN